MSARIADLLLAAGASRRFRGRKLLADCGGETLIDRAMSVTRNAAIDTRLSVFGEIEAALIEAATLAGMGFVVNADWDRGQGTSVAAGVSALSPDCDAVLIRLADQVLVTARDIDALLTAWRAEPEAIVAADYDGVRGVPAVFPRRCFAVLAALDGEPGARRIIASDDHVVTVDLPHAAVDVDTREDLARAESILLSRARAHAPRSARS
ncbi:MAG: nucleotidyltransferase family protein [Pseudomonadota bacterium]